MTITPITQNLTARIATTAVAPIDSRFESATALRAVPDITEARGFALYIGIDEVRAASDGASLPSIVNALKRALAEVAPRAESYATVALAPRGAGGRDVDIVRRALHDPSVRREPEQPTRRGVVVDLSRKRVLIDGVQANLTYKEFRLLEHLIENQGETIHRDQLLEELWDEDDASRPNERTIDVHIRRLRSKLGAYESIVRTVRGIGYRFDDHADVAVKAAA